MKTLLLIGVLTLSINTFAKDTGKGNGGDPQCAEYVDLFKSVSLELEKIGQEAITERAPRVLIEDIKRLEISIKCLPVKKLDRAARSESVTVTTTLDWKRWKRMNRVEKVRLVTHEMSILANYESEGEYYISYLINRLLFELSSKHSVSKYAEKTVFYEDGSVTFIKPFLPDLLKNKVYIGGYVKNHSSIYVGEKDILTIDGHEFHRLNALTNFCRFAGFKSYSSGNFKDFVEMDESPLFFASLSNASLPKIVKLAEVSSTHEEKVKLNLATCE